MAVAGAYGTAMAVELEMGPIMNWTTPARGHGGGGSGSAGGGGGGGGDAKKSKRKRPSRNDSGRTAAAGSILPPVNSACVPASEG